MRFLTEDPRVPMEAMTMDLTQENHTVTAFASLPMDILAIILKHSPDLDTFLSAIASCRAFYNTFRNSQPSLTKAIVFREIDRSALPYAKQVTLINIPHPVKPEAWPQIILKLLGLGNKPAELLWHPWTLAHGIGAIRLHAIINALARQFAARYIHWFEKLCGRAQAGPSDREIARIKRTLYRFEMCCKLVPPPPFPGLEGAGRASPAATPLCFFMWQATAWENEQLAAIHEALWRLVAPALNDVVLHDISWGQHRATYALKTSDRRTEALLARGLRAIHDIAQADTYARRYELIGAGTAEPALASSFLHQAFIVHNCTFPRPGVRGEGIAPKFAPGQEPRFYEDPDWGPEGFWRWLYRNRPGEEFRMKMAGEHDHKSMWDCGCVFWDKERLDSSGILGRRWVDLRGQTMEKMAMPTDLILKQQARSWEARQALYEKGVRGYWSPGEEEEEDKIIDEAQRAELPPHVPFW